MEEKALAQLTSCIIVKQVGTESEGGSVHSQTLVYGQGMMSGPPATD